MNRSKLLDELAREGILPPDGYAAKPRPTMNRGLLRQAAAAEQRRKEAQAAQDAEEERRAARRAEMLAQRPPPPAKPFPWAQWVAGIVVVASVAWPAGVVAKRAQLRTAALEAESKSNAGLYCVEGHGTAYDTSSFWSWLTSGSTFTCTHWETSEARRDRQAALEEQRAMAREKAKRRAMYNHD